jgi:hypothetical protein
MANALTFIESNIEDLDKDKRIAKIKADLAAELAKICEQFPAFCRIREKLIAKSDDVQDVLLQVLTKSDDKAFALFAANPDGLLRQI